jgi:hypothetical protein
VVLRLERMEAKKGASKLDGWIAWHRPLVENAEVI